MASPPARSDPFPSASSLASRCRELAARLLAVRDGDNDDASFLPARRDEDCPNQRIDMQQVAKTCGGAGLIEQDAKEGGTTFILDSGASNHVVGNFSILSSFTAIPAAALYRPRDGRQLVVAGVGTISRGSFQIPDAQYVPDLPTGVVLVSVKQLAERGYVVMCGGGRCHVKDQSTGELVGNGRLHSQNGVYQLEFLKIPPDTTDTTAPDTLHRHSSTT